MQGKRDIFLFDDIVENKDKNKPFDIRKQYQALDFWESGAEFYCKQYEKVQQFQQNVGVFLQLLEILQPKSIMDVGCGFGRSLPFILDGLKEKAPEQIIGVDFCQKMIEYSEQYLKEYAKKDKIKIVMSDARSLPYKDGEFECLMTDALFSHLKFSDAQKVSNEMARVSSKYIICVERFVFDGEHPEPHVFSWDINKFFRWRVLTRKYINQGMAVVVLEKPDKKEAKNGSDSKTSS